MRTDWHFIIEDCDTGDVLLTQDNKYRRNTRTLAGLPNSLRGDALEELAKWRRARTGKGRAIWDLIENRDFRSGESAWDYGCDGEAHEYKPTVSDEVMRDLVLDILAVMR